jgi:RNA polymerase sigma factor (TIGR02999 family)
MLESASGGDAKAAAEIIPLVYEELRRLAAQKMARETPGQTLQPTALVHEAWLRLAGNDEPQFENRGHFFAAAAEAMRRILIDRARRKHAVRHGGDQRRLNIDDLEIAASASDEQILAIGDALEKFSTHDPRKAELVKLRFFAGLKIEEAASALEISEATAKRWWIYSRAWLFSEVRRQVSRGC